MFAAVALPQVVEVDFHFGFRVVGGEGLAIDGAVFLGDGGDAQAGNKAGGKVGAVVLANEEGGSKLVEQSLLEGVGQAVLVSVLSEVLRSEGQGQEE